MSERVRKILVGVIKGVAAILIVLGGYLAYNVITTSGGPPIFTAAISFLTVLLLVLGIFGLLS
ncbi:MAG: hypothetical protein DRN65_00285 [Thaumarchaeota archaeon]|nr:MAG: hypothetical protein DRN47_03575 [Candidatus Wolframiiraptor sp.]RLG08929.1 MAG: hypothetical protein DRN65_00285 [Nitrososphaerota archaeon]HDD39701.1 hypothetical protein [Nitrososphaeria archaeon]